MYSAVAVLCSSLYPHSYSFSLSFLSAFHIFIRVLFSWFTVKQHNTIQQHSIHTKSAYSTPIRDNKYSNYIRRCWSTFSPDFITKAEDLRGASSTGVSEYAFSVEVWVGFRSRTRVSSATIRQRPMHNEFQLHWSRNVWSTMRERL